jgi:hypothetical protein
MLTGDNARAIAEAVGVDAVQAELLPDQKLEHIRELQRQGHVVAMVGDSINDAPALATADVGIAMGAAGSDVAIETAPVALMSDDLDLLPQAVRLSPMTAGRAVRLRRHGGRHADTPALSVAGGHQRPAPDASLMFARPAAQDKPFTKRLADTARTCEYTVTILVIVTGPLRS